MCTHAVYLLLYGKAMCIPYVTFIISRVPHEHRTRTHHIPLSPTLNPPHAWSKHPTLVPPLNESSDPQSSPSFLFPCTYLWTNGSLCVCVCAFACTYNTQRSAWSRRCAIARSKIVDAALLFSRGGWGSSTRWFSALHSIFTLQLRHPRQRCLSSLSPRGEGECIALVHLFLHSGDPALAQGLLY